MVPFVINTLMLLVSGHVGAQELALGSASKALATEWLYSKDSDQFETIRLRQAFSPEYESADEHWRWSVQSSRYQDQAWRAHVNQLGLNRKMGSLSDLQIETGIYLNEGLGQQLVTTDNRVSVPFGKSSRIEGYLVRDWVETRSGLEDARTYWLFGTSLETQWTERWSTVLSLSQMEFSDQNTRSRFLTKLVFDLYPTYGLTAQIWHRAQRDDDSPAAQGTYFSAERYRETLLVMGMTRRYADFRLRARLGWGTQRVDSSDDSHSQLLDLAIEPLGKGPCTLRTVFGFKRGAGVSGNSYSYRVLSQELTIRF